MPRIGVPAQLQLEPAAGLFHDPQQLARGFPGRGRRLPAPLPRHFHAEIVGQFLHCFHEGKVGIFHEKTDGGAVGAATEAVIELL